ncbi:hypothetical protein D3C81_1521420 [compost metagenome]
MFKCLRTSNGLPLGVHVGERPEYILHDRVVRGELNTLENAIGMGGQQPGESMLRVVVLQAQMPCRTLQ